MLKSRVLLLQLMQNCFPMLPNPLEPQGPEDSREPDEGATAAVCPSTSSSEEPLSDAVKAVGELYTHLCHSKNLSAFIQLGFVKKYLVERLNLVEWLTFSVEIPWTVVGCHD